MSVSATLLATLDELLSPIGPVMARRMFGGAGLYARGVMFALIVDETVYLRTDDETRAAFEAEGLGPFAYDTRHGVKTIGGYYAMPERLLDNADEACCWARRAIAAAERAAVKAPSRKAPSRKTRRRHIP